MSLKPLPIQPVPEHTARVAHAAFPKGNLYLRMRDEFGAMFSDQQFSELFSERGQPAEAPWRLAMVTIMQFVENLTDRQATDMVRSRLDWKYVLGLDLYDPGFDATVLCEFRTRLIEGHAEAQVFETLLSAFAARDLLKAHGRQRTDSTHILAAVRALSRLETAGETLRHALNVIADTAPEWLKGIAPLPWFDRYGKRMEAYRLPKGKAERQALAVTIGQDGFALLAALSQPDAPADLAMLPAVVTLRQVWIQQFEREADQVRMRERENTAPGAKTIRSPYDVEARTSVKRDTVWMGYKVHLTETCDADAPHLITDVRTTVATVPDNEVTPQVQEALKQADRLPTQHLVDEGYTEAQHYRSSTEAGIDLVGPVSANTSWQRTDGNGFDLPSFHIDWDNQRVRCPAGVESRRWYDTHNSRHLPIHRVEFATPDCQACSLKPQCTRSKTARSINLRPREEYEILVKMRQRQKTEEFGKRYAARSGIEGTLSQGVRDHGLRTARYVGEAKTNLQHLFVAAALNFCRVFDWLTDTPIATTRKSPLERLRPQPAF
jgi:transposase